MLPRKRDLRWRSSRCAWGRWRRARSIRFGFSERSWSWKRERAVPSSLTAGGSQNHLHLRSRTYLDTSGEGTLTVEERPRHQLRLGEGEEGKPSRTRVSFLRSSATTRIMDGSPGSLKTARPWGFWVSHKPCCRRGSLGITTGLRHTYSDFRRWRRRVRSTRCGGRRWGWRRRVVALSLDKGSEPATSRTGQPGASEGEGENEVKATHFGCWGEYWLDNRTALRLKNNEGGTSDPEVVEPAQSKTTKKGEKRTDEKQNLMRLQKSR